jgi:hypothetical protein
MSEEKPEDAHGETSKELARSLLKEGATIDDAATQSGLNRNTVLGLYSALVRANKRLKVANKRTEAGTEQENDFQAQNQADQFEGATGGLASSPPVPSSLQNVPSGYVLKPALTPSEWKELAALDKGKLVALVADLKASNSSLQAQAVMPKGNVDNLSSYDEQLKRLEVERQRIQNDQEREYAQSIREDRLRNRMRGNDGSNDKRTDFLEKLVVESLLKGRGDGFNIGDFVKIQAQTQLQNLEFFQKQMQTLSEMRPEQMSDEVRLALAKMGQEMDFRKMESMKEIEKYNALGQMFSPLMSAAPQIAGGLLGKGSQQIQNPGTTNLGCVNCGHVWAVTTQPKGAIVCPECKSPVQPEVFAEPQLAHYTCSSCGLEMTVPPNAPEIANLKCPKCGTVTEAKRQTSSPTPLTETPPEAPSTALTERETPTGPTTLRPTYR